MQFPGITEDGSFGRDVDHQVGEERFSKIGPTDAVGKGTVDTRGLL